MLTDVIAECLVPVRARYKDAAGSNAKTDLGDLSSRSPGLKTQVKQCKT